MKTYPYQTPNGIIELVEKREYDIAAHRERLWKKTSEDFGIALDELRAANAELIERLRERTESHLAASARDVQTIQRQIIELASADREIERLNLMVEMMDKSKELAKWQAIAERMANDLRGLANMPEYDQDDAHRLRHIASKALAAYESSNLKPVNPIDEAVKRMEEASIEQLRSDYWQGMQAVEFDKAIGRVRARLIQAAKGES